MLNMDTNKVGLVNLEDFDGDEAITVASDNSESALDTIFELFAQLQHGLGGHGSQLRLGRYQRASANLFTVAGESSGIRERQGDGILGRKAKRGTIQQ